ncbi:MAG: carbamoyl phosphate synthase large subunit [Deltaproteobacteria bacterium RBG_13_61_14]|nr:MAG: carbamoyl phosphate synthase large subunit [Deltaproteobacteria bacterium RBG_13_61_14]
MPKRNDIETILIIGSGPIVIGQACEFDYSGTQAVKALREEGFRVVLVNSNPATIMTDPELAHRTYIEPLVPEIVAQVIAAERPQALLPTLGGQTALNLAVELAEMGVLDQYQVELIGAKLPAIHKAENRELFKQAMLKIGLKLPRSDTVHSLEEAWKLVGTVEYPAIIRPSFTLGGTGGNVATNEKEYEEYCKWGLQESPKHEILIEQSVIGWKEFELEVMRDLKNNVVIICSIENLDPMGVHTGDSVTIAPAQTLTDKEYQIMRDAALAIIREIGVDTGGSNIQFAVNPGDGEMMVIEMNPRVSRSSALASKATGFPIAKIAAKLAVGYTLDEIQNDITRETPASFEPTIDYVVTKVPRFAFEKFPGAEDKLTTQMKSVGEVMAIGRTFKESLQKALRSLEIDSYGLEERIKHNGRKPSPAALKKLRENLRTPHSRRLWSIADAFRAGLRLEEIFQLSRVDPWFLQSIREIVESEQELKGVFKKSRNLDPAALRAAKQLGFSDRRLAVLAGVSEKEVRQARKTAGIEAVFKRVDTCAAEFEAHTPYLYSTYEREDEARPTDRQKIVILGGGPNRIGQGIEFDYCCVHASLALSEDGWETIMVNCNPETVSTDYDTSDRLYFEPLTLENVLDIVREEKPFGVIVQFGGQTPLKLAVPLAEAGVPILGTSPEAIDRAEDRQLFAELLCKLNLRQPENGAARSVAEAEAVAERIGYPVLVRPSYVLGGRAMMIVHDRRSFRHFAREAFKVSSDHPILIDRFLRDAVEVDVDCVADGTRAVIGGIMEHIEEAGVHSGDSACALPPYSLSEEVVAEITRQTKAMALELKVKGLINAQYAVKDGVVYVLEVNPRASRTVPFVSKAIGRPLAKIAARVMAGKSLAELGFIEELKPEYFSVKEAVFPFVKFPNVDVLLGPEMRSTGEVMGIDPVFERAYAKSQLAAGTRLPASGLAFISVKDSDKAAAAGIALNLHRLGFKIVATKGTAKYLESGGLLVSTVRKVKEGSPHIVDMIRSGEIAVVINTTAGSQSISDSFSIRRSALLMNLPYFTTIPGALAGVEAIAHLRRRGLSVKPLQEYYQTKP